jgi:hypothetical protein
VPDVSRIASGEKPSTLKSAVNSSDGSVEQAGYKTTGSQGSEVTAASGVKDDRAASTPDWWK